MKKLFYITAVSIGLLFSCQFEDDNAPLPDESFVKYYGTLANQTAKDIEPIYDASGALDGYVIFGTQQLEDSTADYYVIRTDPFGNLVNEVSFGISGTFFGDINFDMVIDEDDVISAQEIAGQIEVLDNGFLIVGTSVLNQVSAGVSDYSLITYAFLSNELEIQALRPIRASTDPRNFTRDLIANDVKVLSDNSVLIVGTKENISETEFDFYFTRLGFLPDTTYFEKTLGFGTGNDVLVRAFENDDQTISMFGHSQDPGVNGEGGTNVTFVKVNQNGNVLGSNSNGIPEFLAFQYDDILTDVVEVSGGYGAVGTTFISNNTNYAFFMSLNKNGAATFSDTLHSEFGVTGTELQTIASGVTSTSRNNFVVVGQYPNFRTDTESRGADAMFFGVDQIGLKIDGAESNFGLGDGNDTAADAVTLPDGKIVVACTVDFGGGVQLISMVKLNEDGELDR